MLLTSKNQLYVSIWKAHDHFCKSSGEEIQVWICIDTQKEVVIDNLWNMIGFKYVISTALTYRFKASAEMLSLKPSTFPMVKTQRNSAVLKYIQLYMSYLYTSTAAFSVPLFFL